MGARAGGWAAPSRQPVPHRRPEPTIPLTNAQTHAAIVPCASAAMLRFPNGSPALLNGSPALLNGSPALLMDPPAPARPAPPRPAPPPAEPDDGAFYEELPLGLRGRVAQQLQSAALKTGLLGGLKDMDPRDHLRIKVGAGGAERVLSSLFEGSTWPAALYCISGRRGQGFAPRRGAAVPRPPLRWPHPFLPFVRRRRWWAPARGRCGWRRDGGCTAGTTRPTASTSWTKVGGVRVVV